MEMGLVPMAGLLKRASAQGYGVPSFCVWNAESMRTILETASKLEAPVILMNGPGEFPLLGPGETSRICHSLVGQYDVPVALHLDHGQSLEQVRACLEAGYTSVMLDYSTRSFKENVRVSKEVVSLAHRLQVSVEGEIGQVGRADQMTREGTAQTALTDPEEAVSFALQTGVDVLAVSIGNAHGISKLPRLDFKLLTHLHEVVPVPLVLHGGSGIDEEDLRKAISSGIAKVNVASELVVAVRESLVEQWSKGKNLWVPAAQVVAMDAMAKVVEQWITRTDSKGKA
jgi:tagatose 1,6-diphosphate aldolase GatY/KbaY